MSHIAPLPREHAVGEGVARAGREMKLQHVGDVRVRVIVGRDGVEGEAEVVVRLDGEQLALDSDDVVLPNPESEGRFGLAMLVAEHDLWIGLVRVTP